ncbi:MAG TPA: DUF1778 domain-containing protein [Thermoanaerobaculia bacterium]|nr:DUF1778 domain-containing protein [Thermoanaerobaculia bacterium]
MTNKKDCQEYEVLPLSERDRAAFFEALLHPPEPNARLLRGFAEHERRVGPIMALPSENAGGDRPRDPSEAEAA